VTRRAAHSLNKGKQIITHYGHFSNGARRKKKKENHDKWVGLGWRRVIELGRSTSPNLLYLAQKASERGRVTRGFPVDRPWILPQKH
jgi:hypothetical protein